MTDQSWTPPTSGDGDGPRPRPEAPTGPAGPGAGGPGAGGPLGQDAYAADPYRKGGGRRPGIIPLRPLRLGEIWDGAFQALRTNPRAMLGPTLAVVLFVTLAQSVAGAFSLSDSATNLGAPGSTSNEIVADAATVVVPTLISALLTLVGGSVLAGMITVAVSGAVLGRRIRAGELWHRVRGRVPALILLALITGVGLALVFIVALTPGVVLVVVGASGGWNFELTIGLMLILVGLLVGLAGYLALDARIFLAAPVLILEGTGAIPALRRAWGMSRPGFWRLLGIRLLSMVVLGIVSYVFSLPFQAITFAIGFFAATQDDPTGALLTTLIPTAIGSVLAGLVVYPLQASITALQYTDQRMRLEGLDLELARAADAR